MKKIDILHRVTPDEKIMQSRNKIVTIVIGILLIMFILIIVMTRSLMNLYNNRIADKKISQIMELSEAKDNIDSYWDESYFIIKSTSKITITKHNENRLTNDDAEEIFKKILNRPSTKGTIGAYRYLIIQNNIETHAVFLNIEKDINSKNIATSILLIILLISLIILSIVASICSNFIIAPFLDQAEQQKQFIADASHDLKTPLSVIMANADVLEMANGQSKWTQNIKKESKKMAELIDDMLTLSKLESFTEKSAPISVDISDILNEIINEFDQNWKEKNIKVVNKIDRNLTVMGSPQQISRLFRTLMQNATKYCTESGIFEVIAKRNKGKILISLYNTADLDTSIDYNKLFERFYRMDTSRNSKTGGHGIGLSIAKKICELEGYQIRAEKQKEGITFIINM